MAGTLLQVAQANPATAERKFCATLTYGQESAEFSRAQFEQATTMKGLIEQGYFTKTDATPIAAQPTQKYLAVLAHSANPTASSPGVCFGKQKLEALTRVQQLNPEKFTANGTMRLEPEAWVTPELLELLGPTRNDGLFVPLRLVFYKQGAAWQAERR